MILSPESLSELSAEQMREMLGQLMGDLRHKQAIIDKLTHENAVLKRLKFAAQSERFSPEQRSLLEESLDADLQAVAEELEALTLPAQPPNASRCRLSCRGARSATTLPRPPVPAAAR